MRGKVAKYLFKKAHEIERNKKSKVSLYRKLKKQWNDIPRNMRKLNG